MPGGPGGGKPSVPPHRPPPRPLAHVPKCLGAAYMRSHPSQPAVCPFSHLPENPGRRMGETRPTARTPECTPAPPLRPPRPPVKERSRSGAASQGGAGGIGNDPAAEIHQPNPMRRDQIIVPVDDRGERRADARPRNTGTQARERWRNGRMAGRAPLTPPSAGPSELGTTAARDRGPARYPRRFSDLARPTQPLEPILIPKLRI